MPRITRGVLPRLLLFPIRDAALPSSLRVQGQSIASSTPVVSAIDVQDRVAGLISQRAPSPKRTVTTPPLPHSHRGDGEGMWVGTLALVDGT